MHLRECQCSWYTLDIIRGTNEPKNRTLISETFDYKENTDIDTLTREQFHDAFNSVNTNMSQDLYKAQVMPDIYFEACGSKKASSLDSTMGHSWGVGSNKSELLMNSDVYGYHDNTSSHGSWTFSGSQNNILETANSSPILLGAHETNASVSEGWMHTSSSETDARAEGACSLSLTQSDTLIQSQLMNSRYSSIYNESSFCTLKGAILSEKPFVASKQSSASFLDNGLHTQLGFTFYKQMRSVNNVHCREIDSFDMRAWVTRAYELANEFNVPKYKGARVKVISQLNIPQFRHLLSDYKFNIIVDYAEFRFPLSMDYSNFSHIQGSVNHKSAIMFLEAVDAYIDTERGHNALIGPFKSSPFDKLHVSPLMTRPKPDNTFDDNPGVLKYPTVDHIVEAVNRLGTDSLLFKIDLKRAYRTLRSDPQDFSALGIQWKSWRYVDVSVPFGLKCGVSTCHLITDSITHLLASAGIWTCAYLDDVVDVARPANAYSAFLSLKHLITSLGLPIN